MRGRTHGLQESFLRISQLPFTPVVGGYSRRHEINGIGDLGGKEYSGTASGGSGGEVVELLKGRYCHPLWRVETAGAGQARAQRGENLLCHRIDRSTALHRFAGRSDGNHRSILAAKERTMQWTELGINGGC
jgi:hypothetical protein